MKLTKQKLKQIIKEELNTALNEGLWGALKDKVARGMLDTARASVSKWIPEINEIPPKPEREARAARTAMWEEKLKGLGNPGSKIRKVHVIALQQLLDEAAGTTPEKFGVDVNLWDRGDIHDDDEEEATRSAATAMTVADIWGLE